MKQIVKTDKAPKAIGPYSQGVRVGDLLFISGQIPVNPISGKIEEKIANQTKRSLQNVEAIVKEAGCNMKDIVKTTVFLQDMEDFNEMNKMYSQAFEEPYPARACVEVSRLPKDVLVEIEAIVDMSQI